MGRLTAAAFPVGGGFDVRNLICGDSVIAWQVPIPAICYKYVCVTEVIPDEPTGDTEAPSTIPPPDTDVADPSPFTGAPKGLRQFSPHYTLSSTSIDIRVLYKYYTSTVRLRILRIMPFLDTCNFTLPTYYALSIMPGICGGVI